MIKRRYLLLLWLLVSASLPAQELHSNVADSLAAKDYTYLRRQIALHTKDSSLALVYAQALLVKAKNTHNNTETVLAYRAVMFASDKQLLLPYSDSLLAISKKTRDQVAIGSAYLTKGVVYYNMKELSKALDNYLLADDYLARTKDTYSIYKIKYCIAQTKYYLGFFHDAIALLQECTAYFKEENDFAYLNSLHLLGLCYNHLANYGRCSAINKQGILVGRKLNNREMEPYFILSEGINQYFTKNYTTTISKLQSVIPALVIRNDFANESVAWFYIGKSYWALDQKEKALEYLKKVDLALQQYRNIRPDLRETYELLIEYYKKKDDANAQLFYINRLLALDNTLTKEYKYLSGKIFKEYDTKKLLRAKQRVESLIEYRNVIDVLLVLFCGFVLNFFAYRYLWIRKRYRQKFEELMNGEQHEFIAVPKQIHDPPELELNPKLVGEVLKNLEKFEKEKKYLQKDLSLQKISQLLNTNSKYASKIIWHYRDKKIIEYISDLRIDHIVELLKTHNRYRNYTNKALGEEVGFGSTQNFTRAFNNRTGISPTYFIQQLKKENNTGNVE